MQTAFDFEDQLIARKFIEKKAGKLARNWRSRLTNYFAHDRNGDIVRTRPTEFSHVITQEQWDEFVGTRESPEFIAICERNAESASQNKFPYMRGRDTLAIIEQNLVRCLILLSIDAINTCSLI